MARRSKKKNRSGSISGYSPRSRVETHKYTKGGEFTLDGKDYIGEYHIKEGIAWTGPEPVKPQDNVNTIGDPAIISNRIISEEYYNTNKRLRRVYPNRSQYDYEAIKRFEIKELDYLEPKLHVYRPKESAYDVGEDARFFVQKRNSNESYAIEIDNSQWEMIGSYRGIDPMIYSSAKIIWKLVGPYDYIARQNELTLFKAQRQIPSILFAVKSYTEFGRFTGFNRL